MPVEPEEVRLTGRFSEPEAWSQMIRVSAIHPASTIFLLALAGKPRSIDGGIYDAL